MKIRTAPTYGFILGERLNGKPVLGRLLSFVDTDTPKERVSESCVFSPFPS